MRLGEGEQLVWQGRPAWSNFLGPLAVEVMLLVAGVWLLLNPDLRPAGAVLLVLAVVVLAGVFVQRISARYTVTSQRAVVERGLLSRHVAEIELVNVRDIQLRQSIFQRLVRTGTLELSSAGRDIAEVVFTGLHDPDGVKEFVRRGIRNSK